MSKLIYLDNGAPVAAPAPNSGVYTPTITGVANFGSIVPILSMYSTPDYVSGSVCDITVHFSCIATTISGVLEVAIPIGNLSAGGPCEIVGGPVFEADSQDIVPSPFRGASCVDADKIRFAMTVPTGSVGKVLDVTVRLSYQLG